jgi:hypothetical protein
VLPAGKKKLKTGRTEVILIHQEQQVKHFGNIFINRLFNRYGGTMKSSAYSWALISAAAVAALLSCSDGDNPANPPADISMSLVFHVMSADSIPDTLFCGLPQTIVQVCFSDTDGNVPAVTVDGIGASFYSISSSGDSTFATFYLTGDSLQYDSLYTIVLRADGGGPDTMSVSCTMLVLDTNRLGGVRTPAAGMWWLEHQFDTMAFHLDSVDEALLPGDTQHIYVSRYDTIEHYVFNLVIGKTLIGGDSVFVIQSFDTLKGEGAGGTDSLSQEFIFLKHTAASFEMIMPVLTWFVDTLTYRYLDLPLSAGSSWPVVNVTKDTALRLFGIPLRATVSMSGTNSASGPSVRSFSGRNWNCYAIDNILNMTSLVVLDTTIIIGIDTLNAGDTVAYNTSDQFNNAQDYICPDIGMTLGNHTIEAKFDTSFFDIKSTRDTVRKGTSLMAIYDPRTGDTLIAQ